MPRGKQKRLISFLLINYFNLPRLTTKFIQKYSQFINFTRNPLRELAKWCVSF